MFVIQLISFDYKNYTQRIINKKFNEGRFYDSIKPKKRENHSKFFYFLVPNKRKIEFSNTMTNPMSYFEDYQHFEAIRRFEIFK